MYRTLFCYPVHGWDSRVCPYIYKCICATKNVKHVGNNFFFYFKQFLKMGIVIIFLTSQKKQQWLQWLLYYCDFYRAVCHIRDFELSVGLNVL